MSVPLNEVIETDDGLSCAHAVVTNFQVHGESDGTVSLAMTNGDVRVNLFASAAQIEHLIHVLRESTRTS